VSSADEDPAAEALRVARLARLSLEEHEARRLGAELARMLSHFESLAELGESLAELGESLAERGPPRAGARSAPLRADEPAPSWPVEVPLSRAPSALREGELGGFYRVPKTVGGEG
jgi:aspartyl/glutamyl-tRNA(Asn/Gln) amidotransferase C subunit